VGVGSGLLAEIAFTFVLVFVVYATALDPKASKTLAPFSIGVTVLVISLMGAPLTGASMNPARSFGSALMGGQWADHWLYWIGPLIGGLLAFWAYRKLYWGRPE
jgi:glycerol uptake facilitator-like aquaporin